MFQAHQLQCVQMHLTCSPLQKPRKAYKAELLRFHSPDYVQFLAECTPDNKEDLKDEQWQVPGDWCMQHSNCMAHKHAQQADTMSEGHI